MKQTILFTLSVIAQIDDEGLESGEFGEADRVCNKLIDAVNAAVPEGSKRLARSSCMAPAPVVQRLFRDP